MTLDLEKDKLLFLLIFTDILFVFLHILHKQTSLFPHVFFSIERDGGLVLTGKAVDLKSTGPQGSWGFESLALR